MLTKKLCHATFLHFFTSIYYRAILKIEIMKNKYDFLYSSWIVSILISLLLASCCKEQELILPDATAIGANTFGCYVDDELFVYTGRGGVFGVPKIDARYDSTINRLYIYAYTKEHDYIGMSDTIMEVGRAHSLYYAVYEKYDNTYKSRTIYRAEDELRGEIYLSKFDRDNKIVSGTFMFTAKNAQNNETKIISNGRFDIKLTIEVY